MNTDECMASIENRLKYAIADIESFELLDTSAKHRSHKSYIPGRYHYKLSIKSEKLRSLSKIKSHQTIYKILNDLMATQIHSFSIKIL